ncbi:hypothetical protein GCM10017691_18400 [Pseudonocardia petroleophila]|uniref:histidine kinase n=1 Tax=Pseudonocardia petroleophila TaxID=37331 RepID=A0A7G7MH50_9PSEU|nr:HAMP domain-containing sensor histidine kinase [Pseudonocardia petroleophila]QNG52111.1 HAMP domain-containing histidine kinase [Pseudonocardia petroleophila]
MTRDDRAVLRRAWWRSVVQIAAGTTAVLLLTGGVALLLVNDHQSENLDAQLAAVLARADDVADPPPGSYLARAGPDGTVEVTPAAPPGVVAVLTAAANGTVDRRDVDTPEGTFRLGTSDRRTGRWVIANDLAALRTDQRRILQAVLLAEATGLAAALAAAALLSRRSVRPLAEALELQRRFVADASHELRAPLTVLYTRAQMLAARPAASADPDLAAGLHGLVTDTRALGEVVDDLLVAAELDRRPDRDHVVDLDDLADAVVAGTSAHAASRGITLTHEPDPGGPHPVNGHAVALRRAILALVDNAIGHTPDGGHVRITVTATAGSVALTVADDGIGIDPGRADELFDRSRHGDHGTARRFGLGLALVREIAHNHHGTVTADGAPGRGARFTLSLPTSPASNRPT